MRGVRPSDTQVASWQRRGSLQAPTTHLTLTPRRPRFAGATRGRPHTQENHMAEIKLDPKVRKAVADALEIWASSMFDNQTGEWTAVITFGHGARTEEVKTEDDFDYLERT